MSSFVDGHHLPHQTWDEENRLKTVTVNGQTTTFVYDGDGRRVKKVQNGQTTVYIGNHYEKNLSTGVVTKYYYANGQRVAQRRGSAVYYFTGDHLGSTSLVTDASGNEVARQKYYPFGAPRSTGGALPTDYKFTGQRSEEAALGSLYDYGARFYSPVLGRFVQPDTIVPEPGNPSHGDSLRSQALNRYAYVNNNPLRYIDADGHLPIIPILIVGGIVALKAIDYGWTAWDSYQSLKVINDPNALEADKAAAATNLALTAAFEAAEPDDLLPVALPLDDLARVGVLAGVKKTGQETIERLGRKVAQETVEKAVKSGIRPAGQLAAEKVAGTEVHHLIEKRFAGRFGVDPGDFPAVRLDKLDKTFHQQEVTARLFHELPTYPKQQFTLQEIWDKYKIVYGEKLGRQDWLEAIWSYFEKTGEVVR